MDYFVSIQTAAGAQLGEIHSVYAWDSHPTLDKAGTFNFTMPASDPNASLLAEKLVAVCYTYISYNQVIVGSGTINVITVDLDAQGNPSGTLTISGPDRLGELRNTNVGKLLVSDAGYTGPSDIMALAPAGWGLDAVNGDTTSAKAVKNQFANETVLDALIKLTTLTGEHFYAGVGQLVVWTQNAQWISNIYAVLDPDPLAVEGDPSVCVITKIEQITDANDGFIGRLYALGSGSGAAQTTLQGVTLPAAYTAAGWVIGSTTKGYYLQNTAAWNSYGIEAVKTWPDQGVAQSLMETAYEYQRRTLTNPQTYTIQVSGLMVTLRPGALIHVTAHRYVDGYHSINVDGDLFVLDVDNKMDAAGLRSVALTCSSIDRPLVNNTTAVVQAVSKLNSLSTHDQPVAAANIVGPVMAIAHNILSTTHGDTLVDTVVDGDVLIGNVTPKWSRLPISVPAANVLNVLGVAYGETRPSWKTITPASLGPGASQYQTIVTGATPFVPAWSGFLLDGTTGGKTVHAVTNGKTLTLTAVDNYNLTIPATGTVALLGTTNTFSVGQVITASTSGATGTGNGLAITATYNITADSNGVTKNGANFTTNSSTGDYNQGPLVGLYVTTVGQGVTAGATDSKVVDALYGGNFAPQTVAASNVKYTVVYGLNFAFNHFGQGTVVNAYGAYLGINLRDNATVQGNITTAYANYAIIQNLSTHSGVIGVAYNYYAHAPVATGAITTMYGYYAANQGATNVTNAYGLYIAAQSGAATLNYAIYTNAGDIKLMASGSDKFGMWGKTPIVQPTTAIAAATFVANTSGIANDTATWGGYTIGQVVKALQNIGVLG